ncbi:MAG TPA: hypothetical protein VHE12_05370 [bacterium]|nr:hypothetical protein [bacterium]
MIALVGAALFAASCSRDIVVSPNPVALYTHTPTPTNSPTITPTSTPTDTTTLTPTPTPSRTFTPTLTPTSSFTPTFTPTFTSTYTFTSTNTGTPTSTPTATHTPTVTDSPTDTPTDTPSDTPTVTPTDTPAFVCGATPVGAAAYTEVELPTQGGPTGTNDSCATAENIGTVYSGTPLVISGVLNPAGTNAYNGDTDYYLFTAGSTGTYTLTVDCYSTGSDSNLLDIVIFDTGCNYLFDPGPAQPGNSANAPLNPGDSFYFMITAYSGAAPIPYHFTITPP